MIEEVAKDLHEANPGIPASAFLELIKGSRVWEFPWGVIFAVGNDMHIHILTNYRKKVFLRTALRAVWREMFSEHEYLTTSILKNKPEALRFDLRMGWMLAGETDDRWILRASKKDFKYGKS